MMRRDLPYGDTEHLINPLSEPPQPVRANKDGTGACRRGRPDAAPAHVARLPRLRY